MGDILACDANSDACSFGSCSALGGGGGGRGLPPSALLCALIFSIGNAQNRIMTDCGGQLLYTVEEEREHITIWALLMVRRMRIVHTPRAI